MDYTQLKLAFDTAKRPERQSKARPRKLRRVEQRRAAIPADRKCQMCGEIREKSRQWVVINEIAVCKSCYCKVPKGVSLLSVLID